MSADVFLDTNILIYAYDRQAEKKHEVAKDIVRHWWEHRGALISTQVLQEFYVNVTSRIPQPLSKAKARELVEQYQAWPVIANTIESIIRASEIQERYQLSFWDSLIISSAEKGGAKYVVSEDLSHNQYIAGILIQNPFI
jgi:predicted nucleic acid-binding protein